MVKELLLSLDSFISALHLFQRLNRHLVPISESQQIDIGRMIVVNRRISIHAQTLLVLLLYTFNLLSDLRVFINHLVPEAALWILSPRNNYKKELALGIIFRYYPFEFINRLRPSSNN